MKNLLFSFYLSFYATCAASAPVARSCLVTQILSSNDASGPVLNLLRLEREKDFDANLFESYSDEYFQKLRPVNSSDVKSDILVIKAMQMANLYETYKFQSKTTGEFLSVHFQVSRIEGSPNSISILGVFINSKRTEVVHGWTASDITMNEQNEIVINERFVKRNLQNTTFAGFALDYYAQVYKLARSLGLRKVYGEAAWMGRSIWQKFGFKLRDDIYLEEVSPEGKRLKFSQLDLMRRNFVRFLAYQKISISELSLNGKPVHSVDEFHSVEDFFVVKHPTRKLVMAAYVSHNKFAPPTLMEVGRAFCTDTDNPHAGQSIEILDPIANEPRSDRSLPGWYGIKELE